MGGRNFQRLLSLVLEKNLKIEFFPGEGISGKSKINFPPFGLISDGGSFELIVGGEKKIKNHYEIEENQEKTTFCGPKDQKAPSV